VRETAQPCGKNMQPCRSLGDWIEPTSTSTKPRFSCPKLQVRLERRGNVLMICPPMELGVALSGCNRMSDFSCKMH
jgi:hypothetical protein